MHARFFGYNKDLKLQYRGRYRELKDLKPVLNGDSDLKFLKNTEKLIELRISSRIII